MSPRRPDICLTFIGDVTRDSRCSRMMVSCAKDANVRVLALHDSERRFAHAGGEVRQADGSGMTLRRRLPIFWRNGTSLDNESGADLYVASDLYSLPLAARLAEKHGVPFVYDSRELYTDVAALQGRSLMQRFWSTLERHYARKAAAILTVNASIAAILRKRFPDARVEVVRNLPMARAGTPDAGALRRGLSIPDDRLVLLSLGGLQAGRGAMQYLRMMDRITDAVLVFLGEGALRRELESAVALRELGDRVRFAGAVEWDVLPDFTAGADIGLCMIENLGQSYYLSLPNKLFEYIAASVPVITSDFPELSGVVHEHRVGVTADPSSDEDVYSAIRSMLDNAAARAEYREACRIAAGSLHWGEEEAGFLALVTRLLTRPSEQKT